MKLAELQAMFQAGVLAGEEPDNAAVLGSIRNSQRTDRATLFGVYVNAYRTRLTELLGANYPALRALMGEDAFGALAADYIAAEPSRQHTRSYARRLPDFMQRSETWRDEARAIDLARFERALTDAFEAAEAKAVSLDTLAGIEPDRWPTLTFAFHPSLIVIELAAGTVETHEAATAGENIPAAQSGRAGLAVWRSGDDSVYRQLDADEHMALTLAVAGHAFGEICRTVAAREPIEPATEHIAQFLTSWFEDGLVIALGSIPLPLAGEGVTRNA